MFIRWLSYKSSVPQRQQEPFRGYSERWSAILVESVRIDGKPRQRHIACLASIRDIDGMPDRFRYSFRDTAEAKRCKFWEKVIRKLDSLGNRMTAEERQRIEAQIAKKVPCPSQEQYLQWKRDLQNAYRGYKEVKPAVANWPA